MYKGLTCFLLIGSLALTGCSRADKLKREYALMEKSGASVDEKCAKLKEIEAAYLADEIEDEHLFAHIKAEEMCLRGELMRTPSY